MIRNKKYGFLTSEWKDVYEENKIDMIKNTITKEEFEEYYGKFIAAIYINEDDPLPYCMWTENYIVTFEKDSWRINIKSFPKEPKVIQFG